MDSYFREKYESLPRPKNWIPGPPSPWSYLPPDQRNLTLPKLEKLIETWKQNRENFGDMQTGFLPGVALENLGDNDKTSAPAAVLIALVRSEDQKDNKHDFESVVLLTRSMNVSHHKGQVSFPGGMYENTDADLIETALRETEEEIGIDRSNFEIIGTSPVVSTQSKTSTITPVIASCEATALKSMISSPDEVDEIHEIKISDLSSPQAYFSEVWDFGEMSPTIHMYFAYDTTSKPVFIWGATAHILTDILHCLNN